MAEDTTPVSMVLVLRRQMEPTLEMLQRVLEQCPARAWTGDDGATALWQHMYHTLLGLSIWLRWPTPAIVFPAFHRPGDEMKPGEAPAYPRETIAGFGSEVVAQVRDYFGRLTPENLTEDWVLRGVHFTRADIVLGQIRHVQHHVGFMHAQLRRSAGTSYAWVGYGES